MSFLENFREVLRNLRILENKPEFSKILRILEIKPRILQNKPKTVDISRILQYSAVQYSTTVLSHAGWLKVPLEWVVAAGSHI